MAKMPNTKSIEDLRAEVDSISHPAARTFGLLIDRDPEAWKKFLEDFKKGQVHPIITDADGRILDGRNRFLACKMLGVEPWIETRPGLRESAAVAHVMSANLIRRHDDQAVRAVQAAKLLVMLGAENFPLPTQKETAEAIGVSDRTVRDAQHLSKEAPDVADEVEKGNISLHGGMTIAKIPKGPHRDALIENVKHGANKKQAKAALKAIKKESHGLRSGIEMPGLTGRYAILIEVLKNLPHLPHELRTLHKQIDAHPLAPTHARQLKSALTYVRKIDFKDLVAAIDVAVSELDAIIKDDQLGRETPAEPNTEEPINA